MKREQLVKTRKSLEMTQADIATAAGIHRSYYGLIENGNRNPTLQIATKIATALDSSVEQLFPNDIFFANKCYEMKQ
ncbi:MAG: helix-turn-helix transcriptional regulator [Lachnospiraceae bacterium]|nr:helix-turn-helix transcriptional regulator [Lachnospiraceae bacterium]